jgi:hypothetical protein
MISHLFCVKAKKTWIKKTQSIVLCLILIVKNCIVSTSIVHSLQTGQNIVKHLIIMICLGTNLGLFLHRFCFTYQQSRMKNQTIWLQWSDSLCKQKIQFVMISVQQF